MPRYDLDLVLGDGESMVRAALPGGATGDLLEAQILIKLDRTRIIVADVQPDRGGLFVTSLLHHPFGQGAPEAAPPIIGMGRYVRDQVDSFTFVAKRDQAGVADYAPILLPDVA